MKNEICKVSVCNGQGNEEELSLCIGADITKCLQMNEQWTKSFIEQIQELQAAHPSEDLDSIVRTYSFEDAHWNWVNKFIGLNTDEYIWFSLEHKTQIESAMIVKHPQSSRFDNENIFYIDYLAVAPWNRHNPIKEKVFKGLGPLLIKEAGKHLKVQLRYREGFGLHSLPKAANFYQKIGMKDFGPDTTKQNLSYFEMEELIARSFIYG
ncbi:GNAT family N-acetyltransferase [Shewanella algae]|uniref:GNAT family N-acetyltransferase n=1 Tax=Shewanella algae TaxID=38313 RepID=UPI003735620B